MRAGTAEPSTTNDQPVANPIILAQSTDRFGNLQIDGGLGTEGGTTTFNRRGLGTFNSNRLGRMNGHGLGTMTGNGLGTMTGSGLGTMTGSALGTPTGQGLGGLGAPGSSLGTSVPRRYGNQP